MKYFVLGLFLIFSIYTNAQPNQRPPQLKITGKVIDKPSGLPMEFATITFQHVRRPEILTGSLTNDKGVFEMDIPKGIYNVTIEYISYGRIEIKNKEITASGDLGVFELSPNEQLLDELTVRAEKTAVEMKLDKRVYNLGQDLMVKGGSASDVLNNVPSVAVDAEGNVSLRGNESVRILIDGRPSNAINIVDALRMIPAESLDKVEVITNPSARYDAEGSSGIINIVLKKGRESGMNGIFTVTAGFPETETATANINYKIKKFNLFTSQGFRNNTNPGSFFNESQFFNRSTGDTRNYIIENRTNERKSIGYNGNIGFDWFVGPKTTWTNMAMYRNTSQTEVTTTQIDYFNNVKTYESSLFRYNDGTGKRENIEFASNLKHQFKKEDHKLTFDVSISKGLDDDRFAIVDVVNEKNDIITDQVNQMYQLDYVLPIKKNSRFEAGYRGSFLNSERDFRYEKLIDNEWLNQSDFTNVFEYIERVNALYTQFGSKIKKFNYLLGLRWEGSDIDVNQLTSNELKNKRYNNFFPSAFLNYELDENLGLSLSYSRRIQRPRGRQLNPFSEISSIYNIFRGNPDMDPVLTHAIDLGILKRWELVTFSASTYYNLSSNAFQFVRRESGIVLNDGTPVIFTGPVNAGDEKRFGFETNINYNPFKKWRINANFNLFHLESEGEFSFTDISGANKTINLDNKAVTWTARINSKYTLPYKIDWQLNFTYNAPQTTAQGKSIGIPALNTAFSVDVMKDKATINFNISDVFNSRRRIFEANIPGVMSSYTNMQWHQRQFTLGFTYRFNRKKSDRDQQRQQGREEMEGMM
ncbi:MAG: TonB-dependent receptor [Saprospiraceae bacterium]|nr:TonB-dependent receptor [Saprospiraceae bacterium]